MHRLNGPSDNPIRAIERAGLRALSLLHRECEARRVDDLARALGTKIEIDLHVLSGELETCPARRPDEAEEDRGEIPDDAAPIALALLTHAESLM